MIRQALRALIGSGDEPVADGGDPDPGPESGGEDGDEPRRQDLLNGSADALEDDPTERYDPDFGETIVRVSVGFNSREGVQFARMASVGDGHDIRYHRFDAVDFEIPGRWIDNLRSKPGIRFVERDALETPDETYPGWHLDRVDAQISWSNGITGDGATVAIIDTGVSSTHPEVAPNIVDGYAVVDCDPSSEYTDCPEPWDDDWYTEGHGTKVAGVSAGTNNADDDVGVAPDADILAVKVSDSDTGMMASDSATGIEWAANNGADVINCSFGGPSPSTVRSEAIKYAREQGALVVGSAGNNGPCTDCVSYPAADANAIAISAIDDTDALASFSSQGPEVTLTAPGAVLWMPQLSMGDEVSYGYGSGTSFSSPVVSGTAALLYSQGYTDPAAVQTQLESTAEDIGLLAAEQGSGLVDAQAATDVTEHVIAETSAASAVGATEATLNGSVDELIHNGNGAEVWFEYYRAEGTGAVQETPRQTVTATGAVSATVTGLDGETEYEFSLRAETVSTGASSTGGVLSFTTGFDYGTATDPGTWLVTTDLNGEATESLPADPEYSFATDFAGYEITKGTFEHQSTGVTDVYLTPVGGDGSVAGPDTAAHFEVAALADETTETFQLPVRVNNVATNPGTYQLTLETAAGDRLDQRELTLQGGEWKHVMMSCRSAFADGSIEADVVVRTTHDEEHLTIESGGVVADIVSDGRPATLGGTAPATLGNPVPATLGRRREYPETGDPDLVQTPNAYGLTLENAAGRRLHIEHVGDFSLDLKHTDFGQWSVTVPADLELPNWTHRTKAYITRDERTVVEGWVDPISLQSSDQSGTVSGYTGIFELTRGDEVTLSFRGEIPEHKAIERALRVIAPEWETTVVPPADPVLIDPGEISGAPFGILEQLCDDYGFMWLDDERRLKRVVFFPPGALHANKAFEASMGDFDIQREGGSYSPWVKAIGDGVVGEYVDEVAVERIAREQNLSVEDAKGKPRVIEVEAETQAEADALAQGEYRQISSENEVSGTIDLPAERLQPGVAYPMPWDEDAVHGVYSLRFRAGGRVTLPGVTMRELTRSGAITCWCRATWSELSNDEARLFGGDPVSEPGNIQTFSADTLALLAPSRSGQDYARVGAYSGGPIPDDEWQFVHYDWRERADGTTLIRAGHGGEIQSEVALDGLPQIPRHPSPSDPDAEGAIPEDDLWIGAFHNDHFRGDIGRLSMWTQPLSDDAYRRLADRESIPATHLHARWSMDEGPQDPHGLVRDIAGGYHGIPENVEWVGSPQTLEGVSINGSDATAKFAREVSTRSNLETLRKEQQKRWRKG